MEFIESDGAFTGQGLVQVAQLLLAYVLCALVGLERQYRGKPAGLRTHTLVGVASALFTLVSKYGFFDVISDKNVVFDGTRVAAQIVTGIGFLGAGLIITRRHAVEGLTTAASVWASAAIGMACAGGLWLLAGAVVVLHFLSSFAVAPLLRRIRERNGSDTHHFVVRYRDGEGALRSVLEVCDTHNWNITGFTLRQTTGSRWMNDEGEQISLVDVDVVLAGTLAQNAGRAFMELESVVNVEEVRDDQNDD